MRVRSTPDVLTDCLSVRFLLLATFLTTRLGINLFTTSFEK